MQEFIPIGHFKLGEYAKSNNGRIITLISKCSGNKEIESAYNFEVYQRHNYKVGNNNIVVHNPHCNNSEISDTKEAAEYVVRVIPEQIPHSYTKKALSENGVSIHDETKIAIDRYLRQINPRNPNEILPSRIDDYVREAINAKAGDCDIMSCAGYKELVEAGYEAEKILSVKYPKNHYLIYLPDFIEDGIYSGGYYADIWNKKVFPARIWSASGKPPPPATYDLNIFTTKFNKLGILNNRYYTQLLPYNNTFSIEWGFLWR